MTPPMAPIKVAISGVGVNGSQNAAQVPVAALHKVYVVGGHQFGFAFSGNVAQTQVDQQILIGIVLHFQEKVFSKLIFETLHLQQGLVDLAFTEQVVNFALVPAGKND